MEVLTLTIFCREGHRPPMTTSSMTAARSQYLLDLLAEVPDALSSPVLDGIVGPSSNPDLLLVLAVAARL
jgi:hypothetical protein